MNRNYTTVVPKQFEHSATRACDVQSWETKYCKSCMYRIAGRADQSWETNVKGCKGEGEGAVHSWEAHVKDCKADTAAQTDTARS